MTRPGNQELAPEELSKLLGGELPSTLPLEGWRTVTLHCQLDAIGPSDRHPDLVKVVLSFPPPAPPASPCSRCRGRGVIPDFTKFGDPPPVPCPACSGEVTTCSATMLHAVAGRVPCGEPVGHYDPSVMPVRGPDGDLPGGWHRSEPSRDDTRFVWNDMYDGATPHGAAPEPAMERPLQRVGITCPTCGPTALEEHPRLTAVLRCRNCKEHLARGRLEG